MVEGNFSLVKLDRDIQVTEIRHYVIEFSTIVKRDSDDNVLYIYVISYIFRWICTITFSFKD